jgi:hypothetical protein
MVYALTPEKALPSMITKTGSALGAPLFSSAHTAETERVIRTIKEDLVWINDFSTIDEFKEKLAIWIQNYNNDYPHSSIGYKTPSEFENIWFSMNNFNSKLLPLCSIH